MTFNIKPVAVAAPASKPDTVSAHALITASLIYKAKGQTNNAAICSDMATKLARFGSFVSDKQAAFATSLVAKAGALAQADAAVRDEGIKQRAAAPAGIPTPDLFAVMQKHAHFYVGEVTLARKNQDSLVWIKHERFDGVIGRITDGVAVLFDARIRNAGIDRDALVALLAELEANPLGAAVKYGKLSGRCCSCGRDLTADGSIEAGIGPVCILKFNA